MLMICTTEKYLLRSAEDRVCVNYKVARFQDFSLKRRGLYKEDSECALFQNANLLAESPLIGEVMGSIISGLRRPSVGHAETEQLVPTLELSPHQHQLLVESWTLIHKDIAKIGVIIFIKLFEVHRECKNLFIPFRHVEDLHELKNNKDLRAHGLRVLSFVEKSIARIDNSARLEELSLELGKIHYGYHAPPKYYQYVVDEFMSAIQPLLKDKWTPELENAWRLSTIIRAVESHLEQLTEHLTEEEQEVRNSDKEKKHLEGKSKEKNLFAYICALMRRGYDEEETKGKVLTRRVAHADHAK